MDFSLEFSPSLLLCLPSICWYSQTFIPRPLSFPSSHYPHHLTHPLSSSMLMIPKYNTHLYFGSLPRALPIYWKHFKTSPFLPPTPTHTHTHTPTTDPQSLPMSKDRGNRPEAKPILGDCHLDCLYPSFSPLPRGAWRILNTAPRYHHRTLKGARLFEQGLRKN